MKRLRNISKLIALLALGTVLLAGCADRAHRWGHENGTGHIVYH
jgi:hypothetical protein